MMQSRFKNHPQRAARNGFSLVEILATIVLLGILATIGLMSVTRSKEAVVVAKLDADVMKLNQIISLYLAEGGSLDGLSSPQAILDKLKTVRTDSDAKRQVSMMTGRALDVRLAARAGNPVAGARKAMWNGTTKQFEITTGAGSNSVADFYLDDSLLSVNYPVEARTRSAMLYNDVNGWVWAAGTAGPAAYLPPVNVALAETDNSFDPDVIPPSTTSATTTSSSTTSGTTTSGTATAGTTTSTTTTSGTTTSTATTSGSTATGLPKPTNTPNGGTYTEATFPTSITVNRNGAPTTGSVLRYRVTPPGGAAGPWTNYTGPVTIAPGSKFESQNYSTDAVLYTTSATDSDTYYKLVDSFSGAHTPSWINVAGGPSLVYLVNNSNANNVGLNHGDTRMDLGGGEYLDAGVENRLNFTRAAFDSVPANTDFTLGELVILNGTTFNDSEATSGTLRLSFNITEPVVQTSTANLNYSMTSTPNTSDRLASADTVTLSNPTSAVTVSINGVVYTLQIRMESLDAESGLVNGNTFHVYEGASARARLVGKFVSNK